ncbi:glycoside hydrolase family 65 protein [Caldisalinibacter kiritimatiensis]|uniref:Maltose phosphorylase / Trehalose phosphorylase n=1 Tax=Caldisalinibacter kiritimatiensis TaxID=1304284 RepID=R1CW26_9FIRM|nr:glycoside hydrolase family 65 protein [Caldisalinibacter kiritimatiensis]EOD00844.1 Maltose phosphorylase / Trehalose phosphorylase [Caldisalinibacter kiritimatiensis]
MVRDNFVKESIYPLHEWNIIEENFDVETNYLDETIFSLGNGYIGMRGNFEEGYNGPSDTSVEGTYLNGFYETHPIKYGEPAFGYAKNGQTMLNVTNSKIIKLYIDDEEFNMFSGNLVSYKRILSMKKGTLTRDVIWESPKGKKVNIKIKRFISLANKHLASINYEVVPLNFSGKITIASALDGDVKNLQTENDPRVGSALEHQPLTLEDKFLSDSLGIIVQKTPNTKFTLVCGMENELKTTCNFSKENKEIEQRVENKYIIDATEGEKIVLNKYITYYTSRDYLDDELIPKAKETLTIARKKGFEKNLQEHIEILNKFWEHADVEIKGDKALQQGIRFNEFHLLQSVGKDGKTNIAAKGLTGQGYEGHYFWDTEVYIFPFFLYNYPKIARKLLEYRYSILDSARKRAREMAHKKGALYPWRTIAGEECSAYYPAGTAQYHINADIIYAVKKYIEVTEDMDFLLKYGAEMVFETARLWADLGSYIPKKGNKFCIDSVTGPDEYTAIVNNNFYTNYMAKMNLEFGYDVANLLKDKYLDVYNRIKEKINLEEDEIYEWKKAADNMYLPYDEELDIYPQDDNFLEKPVWDFENTPKENYPLLLHYHPLVIYRHQVCKQPDVLLAMYLYSDEFTKEVKKKNYDYYEPVTTHDSSLSTCVFSILASEIGYNDKAYKYFMHTARIDLDNYHNNSQHGVHTACMGGTWMSVVNGFAGMRVEKGQLKFNPYLPNNWDGYRFRIMFKGRRVEVNVDRENVTYKLLDGKPINFKHGSKSISLTDDEMVKVPIEHN